MNPSPVVSVNAPARSPPISSARGATAPLQRSQIPQRTEQALVERCKQTRVQRVAAKNAAWLDFKPANDMKYLQPVTAPPEL